MKDYYYCTHPYGASSSARRLYIMLNEKPSNEYLRKLLNDALDIQMKIYINAVNCGSYIKKEVY